jgi:hypothetical protein
MMQVGSVPSVTNASFHSPHNSFNTDIYAATPPQTNAASSRPSTLNATPPVVQVQQPISRAGIDAIVAKSWLNKSVEVTNIDGTKRYVSLDYSKQNEQSFYVYADGHVEEIALKKLGSYTCSDGSNFDSFGLEKPIDTNNPDLAKRVAAVIHTHEDKSIHEPYPGPQDGRIPQRLGVPNYGLSSQGAWKMQPPSETGTGGLGVSLISGQLDRQRAPGSQGAFDVAAFTSAINRGKGDVNAGNGVTCKKDN